MQKRGWGKIAFGNGVLLVGIKIIYSIFNLYFS
jgi:hypothetical protein